MKQMVCEMCGGKELIKQDGTYTCQSCGTKYSVEEAKKMMVTIDNSAKLENALQNARRAMEDKNYEPAGKYYETILMEEPENWEAAFYSVYSKAMQSVTQYKILHVVTSPIENSMKTILKNIKTLNDTAQQNKAVEQIKTDLFVLTSEAYKLIMDKYNSQKPTFEGYDSTSFFGDEDVIKAKVEAKLMYSNVANNDILPFSSVLNFFGKELVSEFGKNEFTNSINMQCHETAFNTLKKLHNETFTVSTWRWKIDESKFISILQQYADELEKIKPLREAPRTPEKESPLFADTKPPKQDTPIFADLEPKKKVGGSFPTKPHDTSTGTGNFSPIFIIGILVLAIIVVIIVSNQEQNTSNREGPSNEQTKKETRATANIGDQKIKARVQLEQAIKANLREPKSYQNITIDAYPLEEYIFVTNTFRGKNRYGGYEVCTFVAQFNFNTKPIDWEITNKPSRDSGCRAIMTALP